MIIVLRANTPDEEINKIINTMETEHDIQIHQSKGTNFHLLGLVGDTSSIDPHKIQANPMVEKLIYVQEPYKKANKIFHPHDTIFKVGDQSVGGDHFSVIAGPCSIEDQNSLVDIAQSIKQSGAHFLRGGAFKPRTSPYSFQGLGHEGIDMLCEARSATGLPIVSELMSADEIDLFVEKVDIIQIGARNMQNFSLLKEIGKTRKTILLKRGLSATIEELLMSAEYIMAGGNENVILCERGIRTFEKYTRNTLDISAVPVIKKYSHLPIFIDPSHAAGMWWLVEPLAMASLAVGADGLMIEVHNDPQNAMCDGQQSIKPSKFDALMTSLKQMAPLVNKKI